MKLKLFREKAKYLGVDVKNMSDAIRKIKDKAEYLSFHNKNYTLKQYAAIKEIYDIVSCFRDV